MVMVVGYCLACAAFLVLVVQAVSGRRRTGRERLVLAIPLVAGALWAGATAASPVVPLPDWGFALAEIGRGACWIGLLAAVVLENRERRLLAISLLTIVLGGGAVILHAALHSRDAFWSLTLSSLLLYTIAGFVLLEQLYRSASEQQKWMIKHLSIALVCFFGFDLYFFSTALVMGGLDIDLLTARGYVAAFLALMATVSIRRLNGHSERLHLSHGAAFQSMILVACGLYLVSMAAIGYYLRHIGGAWGGPIEIVFFFATLALLGIGLSSGALRARLRVVVSKHFFKYRYDYRNEWLGFTATITGAGSEGLHERIVKAVAAIIESTGGALWTRSVEDGVLLPTARWNMGASALPAIPLDSSLCRYLQSQAWVVDLSEALTFPDRYPGLTLPDWLAEHPRAGLCVPLILREELQGVLVLGPLRAPRKLVWEDLDILKTVGCHAAGYLSEERALNRLSDAQRLDAFNRRFAFVIHDIKNVVSQMCLMAKNAERFGDNPDFQKDMIATVVHSADRLQKLLHDLKAAGQTPDPAALSPAAVPLAEVVREAGERWRALKPDLLVDLAPDSAIVCPGREMASVLDHLLQNAIDAVAASGGAVRLSHREGGGQAIVEVTDEGPGMEDAFIADGLFRPLNSTKSAGLGIGAFQCREIVRRMGGQLSVTSDRGRGTRMTVLLPDRAAQARGAA
ncbi:histidine kinase [Rhodospirillum rubrum]|uniref:XrtA/PEP-CTERM system histidine kinase PrsK n=2 Tax=Rhodospirillum rubrum TaxID=1085 RepID=UPI00190582BA|nr:XrtA/PEP-CTERM system histidine kinase PrsK [Rhodospirillum rubrum]MBK1665961.1 histidine kinase [Rhodospirillum rubrum]